MDELSRNDNGRYSWGGDESFEDKCRKRGLRRSQKERIRRAILADLNGYLKRVENRFGCWFADEATQQRRLDSLYRLCRKDEGKAYHPRRCPSGRDCGWCQGNRTHATRRAEAAMDEEYWEGNDPFIRREQGE